MNGGARGSGVGRDARGGSSRERWGGSPEVREQAAEAAAVVGVEFRV